MRPARLALLTLLAAGLALAQTGEIDVGSGAPSETIRVRFRIAFFRGDFQNQVSLPPLGLVRNFGPTGLNQEFADKAKTQGVKLALVRATRSDLIQEDTTDVFQVRHPMYAYYLALGVNTAGYPATDTIPCATYLNSLCQYQHFDKKYALFTYWQGDLDGQEYNVKDPLYTRWVAAGGMSAVGSAIQSEENVTSGANTGVTAVTQRFTAGALYSVTSGALNGRVFAVRPPFFAVYAEHNTHAGFLGLPTADETTLSDGRRRQTFEGGAIEYTPGSTPVLRLPVSSVIVNVTGSLVAMKPGDTVKLEASTYAANGALLEARPITWTTSNNRVAVVEPVSGASVTLRAVGGGTAEIRAVSEGKSSRVLNIFVSAPCCQVGEGAPTATIQQSFESAVSRHRLNVKLPASNPVRRVAAGYLQDLEAAQGDPPARYLVAKPDSSPNAFVVASPILDNYLQLGGPAGNLGYPLADATPGGRQLFEKGALAGNPVFAVTGTILSRWAAQGYETGPAGLPTGAPASFLTFAATAGQSQSFTGAVVFAAQSGSQAGRAYLVSGAILARFATLGATAGEFGAPVSDEFTISGKRRQEFEGGYIEYAPGETEAREVERERRPQISATPSDVVAGIMVRVAAGGFDTGATLRISMSNQSDFVVKTQTGSYAWLHFVPADARPGLVNLRAVDVNGSAIAVGSFVVTAASEALLRLSKVRGEAQAGPPGARLPIPLQVRLTDESGNPVAGAAVRFQASPGAALEGASAATDAAGEAQAWLRLPLAELPALATVSAGRQVVTFGARVSASTLTNFPRFRQEGATPLGNGTASIAEKGALLAAAAAIVRHHQNLGELASPSGFAETLILNQFLKDYCVFSAQGGEVCDGFLVAPGSKEQIVNLWRLAAFVGGNLDVVSENPAPESIRDALARGGPVLVGLSLTGNEAPAGSHFVVAIGVAADGTLVIHDPSALLNRARLEEYTSGFTAGGRQWRGAVNSALRLVPRLPSPTGFLLFSGDVSLLAASRTGACAAAIAWPDFAAGSVRFHYCDGLQADYQLDVGGEGPRPFTLTDLGIPGNRQALAPVAPATFRLSRPTTYWTASVQQTAFNSSGVVNGASFTPALAPGSLMAIFGNGLAVSGKETTVEVGGVAAPVISATPFQLNVQVPLELAPGTHAVKVRSPFGGAEQTVAFQSVAPALFTLDGQRGAILNQDGSLNGPFKPAPRGQVIMVYATGLGNVVDIAVVGLIEGQEIVPTFAGLAPGFAGLYQVNLPLPASLPPGHEQRLVLRQGIAESNAVLVSIQ